MSSKSILPPYSAAVKCCGQSLPFSRISAAKTNKAAAYASLQVAAAHNDHDAIEASSELYTQWAIALAQAEVAQVLAEAKPLRVSLAQFARSASSDAGTEGIDIYETTDADGEPVVIAVPSAGVRHAQP